MSMGTGLPDPTPEEEQDPEIVARVANGPTEMSERRLMFDQLGQASQLLNRLRESNNSQ